MVDLDDAETIEYNALYYQWGTEDATEYILLDGCRFPVRPNLWSALWHIRCEDQTLVLWCDAICIDQENLGERNHQVSTWVDFWS